MSHLEDLRSPGSSNRSSKSKDPRRAVIVGLIRFGQPGFLVDEHLDELEELAASNNIEVLVRVVQSRKSPDPKTFIGRGKAEEVKNAAGTLEADLVIFDDDLSPSQIKNLEGLLDRQVIDRSALILDIFVQRARTREARTQVELAQLNYLLPRLTRRWTHLSRQAGGIGMRGGEGEKQLEADRRMLRTRIKGLKKQLEKIEKTREVQRRGRRDTHLIAMAGYTNAGKSTLFNKITKANVRAEDRLFATLDSRLRNGSLGPGENGRDLTGIFSDTVGFIRKLPHHLVASFRSTLEEITQADLVLHVIDRSHPRWQEQMDVADEVLKDLGVDEEKVLKVFNKSDLLPEGASGNGGGVWVSALTGMGIDELKLRIRERLGLAKALETEPEPVPTEEPTEPVPVN